MLHVTELTQAGIGRMVYPYTDDSSAMASVVSKRTLPGGYEQAILMCQRTKSYELWQADSSGEFYSRVRRAATLGELE